MEGRGSCRVRKVAIQDHINTRRKRKAGRNVKRARGRKLSQTGGSREEKEGVLQLRCSRLWKEGQGYHVGEKKNGGGRSTETATGLSPEETKESLHPEKKKKTAAYVRGVGGGKT